MVTLSHNLMFTATADTINTRPDSLSPLENSNFKSPVCSGISTNMWRNTAKRACKELSRPCLRPSLAFSKDYICRIEADILCHPNKQSQSRLVNNSRFHLVEKGFGFGCGCYSTDSPFNFGGVKGFAGVAEPVSSTDADEDPTPIDEIQELLDEMKREEQRQVAKLRWQNGMNLRNGMAEGKYKELRKRQVKIETEVWEEAAKEYRELLMDMCEQKLAPNLPYMKSLFLGWFEPLRDAIKKEQEMYLNAKKKTVYAPYFIQLPPEKMAVITMHKMMGLLMTGTERGSIGTTRVVQAVCSLGDAIEQEVRIHKFLEKTNKKRGDKGKKNEVGECTPAIKEEEKLRKKVIDLMKKQKLAAVRGIVKGQDDTKPWGPVMKTKVGSRLVELLTQTAYIQPPSDQSMDGGALDIRPAFVHSFRTMTNEAT